MGSVRVCGAWRGALLAVGADSCDDAGISRLALACGAVEGELEKRRFGFHAEELLEEAALGGDLLEGPFEQAVELEAGGTRGAIALNDSLVRNSQSVAGKGNRSVAIGVRKIANAHRDDLLVGGGRGIAEETLVLRRMESFADSSETGSWR